MFDQMPLYIMILDIIVYLNTGYYSKGLLILKKQAILKNYLNT